MKGRDGGFYQAVVFDMDGVLIDSEPIVKVCGQRAAMELGAELTDELYNDLIGLPSADVQAGLEQAFGAGFPMDEFRRMLERMWRDYIATHGIAIKPGVEIVLETLNSHRIPYAIATSTPYERAVLSLETAGLIHQFESIVAGDQVEKGKPAPDIFIAAADRIDAPPQRCIALEDSKVGVHAATSAQMYTLMIPDQKPPDVETRERVDEVHDSMHAALPRIVALLGLV